MFVNVIQKRCLSQPLLKSLVRFLVFIAQAKWTKARGNKRITECQHATSRVKIITVALAAAKPGLLTTVHFRTEIAELHKIPLNASMGAFLIPIALLVLRAT